MNVNEKLLGSDSLILNIFLHNEISLPVRLKVEHGEQSPAAVNHGSHLPQRTQSRACIFIY